MTRLEDFLVARRKGAKDPHTHTWFSAGKKHASTWTLSVSEEDREELLRLLTAYVHSGKRQINCVTEKVPPEKFTLFVDLDFDAREVAKQVSGLTDGQEKIDCIQNKMRDVVLLYRDTLGQMTGKESAADVEMVMATRLPYKIHLHFPGIVVDKHAANSIGEAFCRRFKDAYPDLFGEKIFDHSVYNTGLRLLYCHKGTMGNHQKQEDEKGVHIGTFGQECPYYDSYYVTDIDTWEKILEPAVCDLKRTTIFAASSAAMAHIMDCFQNQQEAPVRKFSPGTSVGLKSVPVTRTEQLQCFLATAFEIPSTDIRVAEAKVENDKIIIPTRCKVCPFARREHANNRLYFLISKRSAELRCHDDQCVDTKELPLPSDLTRGNDALVDEEEVKRLRQEYMVGSLNRIKELHPQFEITDADLTAVDERMMIGGYPIFARKLGSKWCPIHRREHDAPENCIFTSVNTQEIICHKQFGQPLSLPFDKEKFNLIFNVQVINNNVVNNYAAPPDSVSQLFETVDDVFIDDPELNRLVFAGLKGFDLDLAAVFCYMGKDLFGVSSTTDAWWAWDALESRWVKSSRMAEDFCRTHVAEKYSVVQRFYQSKAGTQNKIMAEQNMQRCAKIDGILKKLRGKDKSSVLHEAATTFGLKDKTFENRLDANKDLLGFCGYTYDLSDHILRPSLSGDMLTMSTGYQLPDTVDQNVRGEIMAFVKSIMPDEDAVNYLLKWLASTLDGHNREEIFTICTGIGRNGKGVLRDLMNAALGDYSHDIQASMLTNERPSSSAPCPDLLHLKGKRFVSGSEPEKAATINGGFVKFLSGNDPVTGRFCHQNDELRFEPQHSLALWCNKIPALDSQDDAIWSRSRVIHFPFKFTTHPADETQKLIDMTLKTKAKKWGPQFMLLLLEHYVIYKREGLNPTDAVVAHTTATRRDNDVTLNWIEQNIKKKDDGWLNRADTWKVFKSIVRDARKSDFIKRLNAHLEHDATKKFSMGGAYGWDGYCLDVDA